MPNIAGQPAFPVDFDDGISLLVGKNNAAATLASNVTSLDTTITLTTGQGANLAVSGALSFAGSSEVLYYATKTGDVLSDLVRPNPQSHVAGTVVENRITAQHHNGLVAVLQALEAKLGKTASTPAAGKMLVSDAVGSSIWIDRTYTHDQIAASSSWVITHNLGIKPSVTVIDSAGNIVYGDITYNSDNQVTVTFTSAFSGKALLN